MTAWDSVLYVLGAWVGVLLLILAGERARQEWVARRPAAEEAPVTAVRPFIPAQRTGAER